MKDGGPAYPSRGVYAFYGMSMRQYYKAAALQGLPPEDYQPESLAKLCGATADAMLAEDAEQEHAD